LVVLLLLAGCSGKVVEQRPLGVMAYNETERILRIEVTAYETKGEDERPVPRWNTTLVVEPGATGTDHALVPDATYTFEAYYPGYENAMVRGVSDPVQIGPEGDPDRALIVRARSDEVTFTYCSEACGPLPNDA
jgi:hypothetical protein